MEKTIEEAKQGQATILETNKVVSKKLYLEIINCKTFNKIDYF